MQRRSAGKRSWNGNFPAIYEGQVWTRTFQSYAGTSITLSEIRFGLQVLAAGKRRAAALMQAFDVLLQAIDHRVASFDTDAAEYAGALRSARQKKGRPGDLRDTMIAGIVLAHRASLATRNTTYFDDLSTPLVNPWHV